MGYGPWGQKESDTTYLLNSNNNLEPCASDFLPFTCLGTHTKD